MTGKFLKALAICAFIALLGVSVRFAVAQTPAAEPAGEPASESSEAPEAAAPESPASAEPAAESRYDFSDTSHWNLTVSAWEHLAQKDYEGVFAYARKCLELYEEKAKEMALGMKSFSRPGHEDDFALVNDVATSRYIMGETYMKTGKKAEALKEFEYVIKEYPYAQCWDPKGWFWKVAEVSQKNIDKIGPVSAPALQEASQ